MCVRACLRNKYFFFFLLLKSFCRSCQFAKISLQLTEMMVIKFTCLFEVKLLAGMPWGTYLSTTHNVNNEYGLQRELPRHFGISLYAACGPHMRIALVFLSRSNSSLTRKQFYSLMSHITQPFLLVECKYLLIGIRRCGLLRFIYTIHKYTYRHTLYTVPLSCTATASFHSIEQ